MIKVVIKKNNIEKFSSEFATQELATAWLNKCKSTNYFGKNERWVSEDRLQIEKENVDNSIEMMIEPIHGQDVKLYKFAAEYTVETSDITAEVAAKKKISDRAKKRAFGEALIDKISSINDSKNLSIEQVDAFMSNTLISSLREHLWAGNLDTFISKLQSSDVSAFFTTQEKSAVITECQLFLTSLGE